MKKSLIKRTKRIKRKNLFFFVVIFFVFLAADAVRGEWVAYNDNLREAGDSTAANVTGWTIHNNDLAHSTGRLKNFETGSEASMPTVTFTMGNAGLSVSSGGSGGNAIQGTVAYEIFHDIVDLGPNLINYGGSGWWVEIEFTGLDPAKMYSFVGTAIRSSNYPSRITLFTISNAVSYVNNSSDGIVERSESQSKLLAGNNSVAGFVIRWDDIVPSAGGSFKIRAEAAPESEDGKAYPFGGFMLEELGKAGNRPPEVDAGDYDSLTWPNNSLRLSPFIEDDDPCDVGILTIKWSKLSGPGTVIFEPGDDIADPCAIFSEPGDYKFQLQVRDELDQAGSGTVWITVLLPLLGDFNADNKVNWRDTVIFAAQWLDPQGSPADLNARDGVNMADFAILAENWLEGEGAILVINEFLARNDLGIPDPQGQRDDWIEIYNCGQEAINIGGMYLTDDLSEPTKWRVPNDNFSATTISPGGYLLIWADNETTDAGLHAGFQLDAESDEIGLFDTDGITLLDSVTFGNQTPDVSYGREPDATSNLVTLNPTPGASNNGSYLAVVADTKFSHDRGFYDAPFDAEITCETPGAIICYTIDGSTPTTTHGLIYSPASSITISTTTCLRAMAFLPGWKSTNVDTHTYIFLDDVIKQATNPATSSQVAPPGYPSSWGSVTGDYQVDPDVVGQNGTDRFGGLYANTIRDDLKSAPTISLVMDKDDWFGSKGIYINQSQDGTERVCSIEYIDPNTKDEFQANCAMAMQGGVGHDGGGTSLQRWKSFKLSMRPRFKTQTDDTKAIGGSQATGGPPKLNFKLFADSPVDRHNTFVLDGVLNHSWLHPSSGQTDYALYIQDQYVADLHNAMGGYSPHGSYAHIYINGLYWGMYYIHERPDHAWAAEMFGGDEDEYDAIKHHSGNVINNGIGGSATANYNAMVNAANAVQSDPTSLAKYNTLTQKLDVDNFITYLLANWFCDNGDWAHKNWYATHRNHPDGRWRFHSWDAEHTLDEGGNDIGDSPSKIHDKLDGNAEYRMRFADLVHRHFFNGGPLSYPASAQLYQKRINQIDRTIVGESARWGDNRRSTPYTREDWLRTAEDKLSSFFPGRSTRILNYLKSANLYPSVSAPVFGINGVNQHGGHVESNSQLSMTAFGMIWYSLNGADPRIAGGSINSSAASVYNGPVALTKSTTVTARVLSGTTWSALNEAIFAVGPVAESLRITEIMYNPQNINILDDPNTEFIELKNIGTQSINLNYVSFTNGIDFTFPDMDLAPGEYILVVEDIDAFTNKYGPSLNIAGEYFGSLNNGGERIELLDAAGSIIHDFKYSDGWFIITDGMDFSLVVIDPHNIDPNAWGDKSTWRPSTGPGGSPGTDNAGQPPEIGGVIINEVLAHSHAEAPDWIELYNTNGHAINIGGWFLSDDSMDLKKYEIPDTTIIEPYGYIVFYEDLHFGNPSAPGSNVPFGLSENGETLYLNSGSDGELTGYSNIEKFGASATGVSFGRYLKSTGSYNFVAMSEITPGGANAYPKVGPVVINEIMYNPPVTGDAEYVELLNISDSPVVLYDPVTGEPWRFTDDPDNPGIDFFFPTNPPVTLEAGEYLLLVSDSAAFYARYNVPAGVQVFEWPAGKLDNAGEKIQLSMPGDVDLQARRYWIRVDRVTYSDGSHPDDTPGDTDPWPAEPDGVGYSLSRISPTEYGNDPVNWQATTPSPGLVNP